MRFEDLDLCKRAARLSAERYQAFNGSRELGFRDQITRSALSIASNIAEGHERDTTPDRVRVLHYAKGSCGELRTRIYVGIEAGYIPPERGHAWLRESRELSAMRCGLIRHFR